ncbi:MAG: PTS sugar transporter subunit IIA [Kiritimatiellia bacterium]|nr:PTS sugar transporter subunit IIA [Lentisphaerota bacterium]
MKLNKLLTPEAIMLGLRATDKDAVLEEMVEYMAAIGRISDRPAVLECVRQRESKMSTGMQCGIAIPHGKTDSVKELTMVMAIHPPGIDFQSMDGEPSRIFIMTVSPLSRVGPHIQFLAEISQLLNVPRTRERLLQAASSREAVAILLRPG